MSLLAVSLLVVSLGIYLIPVRLLQRRSYTRTQDYFISSERTPPDVIQNSSIAYILQAGSFGALFAWGASGDFWPAIVNSVSLGVGLYLVYVLRRPMLEFMKNALNQGRSITLHEFIAQHHGNDPRVRLLASGLTLFALLGLAAGEAFGVATLLRPIIIGADWAVPVFVLSMSLLMMLYAIPSGNSGAMHSAQIQLGIAYLSLFGAMILLLYMLVAELKPVTSPGLVAVAFVAVSCFAMILFRHSRFVDTSPIGDANPGRGRPSMRLFRRFGKILNACISILAVMVTLLALTKLYSDGSEVALRGDISTLLTGTHMSKLGLMALFLFPLFHQIVDMTNWQRVAAFEKDGSLNDAEPSQRSIAFRRVFRVYAVESPIMRLFMCMFGAISAMLIGTASDAGMMQALVQQLVSQQNSVAAGAFTLLLIGMFAIALSTMSLAFSASLCAIRYDMLPAFWPESSSGDAQAAECRAATWRTVLVGSGLYLIMAALFCITGEKLRLSFGSNEFIGILFAFGCAQLSFVPLILGPVIGRTRGGLGAVSSGWALSVLGVGAAAGGGAAAIYLITGSEPWLWAAAPACLGSGFLLFAIARLWPAGATGAA